MASQITAIPKSFLGIDNHSGSWKVHFATDLFADKSFSRSPDTGKLQVYVSKHYPDHEVSVAHQAGCCGQHAHHYIKGYGRQSLVV